MGLRNPVPCAWPAGTLTSRGPTRGGSPWRDHLHLNVLARGTSHTSQEFLRCGFSTAHVRCEDHPLSRSPFVCTPALLLPHQHEEASPARECGQRGTAGTCCPAGTPQRGRAASPTHLPPEGCGTEMRYSCTSPCRAWQGYKGSFSEAFGERRLPGDRTRPSGLWPTQQRPFGYLRPLVAT